MNINSNYYLYEENQIKRTPLLEDTTEEQTQKLARLIFKKDISDVSIEELTNPVLRIQDDVAKYLLPQFLDEKDLFNLAKSNFHWENTLTPVYSNHLPAWKKNEYLALKLIESNSQKTLISRMESILNETSKKLDYLLIKNEEEVTITHETLPQILEDIHLISLCKKTNLNLPERKLKESMHSYAEKLRHWIKNSNEVLGVTSLNLSNEKLLILPKEIVYFKNLESIKLANNWLDFLPKEIDQLPKLKSINVQKNKHLKEIPLNAKKKVTIDGDGTSIKGFLKYDAFRQISAGFIRLNFNDPTKFEYIRSLYNS